MMEVTIGHFAPVKVFAMRHNGPYMECGQAWERLITQLQEHGLFDYHAMAIGVGYDNPDEIPENQLRMDVCIAVPEGLQENVNEAPRVQELLNTEKITIMTIGEAGREYAIATVKGPYIQLADAYRKLYGEWVPANKRYPDMLSACPFECYINSPHNTAEENLITKIYAPLLKV